MMLVLLAFLACTEPAEAPKADAGTCGPEGPRQVAVMTSMLFARASEDGVSEGFDLDGETTVAGGPTGCGIADYVDPRGNPGIDHGFARIIPALMATEAAAVEGLVQSAINDGELLLMFDLQGLDDTTTDSCVSLDVTRGMGETALGTDGTLEWSQTFDRNEAEGSDHVPDAYVEDGALIARPLDIDLPIQILNADLVFHLHDGGIRIQFEADGSLSGFFGGAVNNAEIKEVAGTENVDAALAGLMSDMLDYNADLSPDAEGVCQQIAMNFEFTAAPAFFFEGEE